MISLTISLEGIALASVALMPEPQADKVSSA